MGCSALTTLTIMPNGDVPFCHRLIDPPWVYGNVYKGFDISKSINFMSAYNTKNTPECMACPIRKTCNGQCAGASYEYWGNPWMPIASICDYFKLKFYVFYTLFDDWKQTLISVNTDIDKLKSEVESAFGENILDVIMDKIK